MMMKLFCAAMMLLATSCGERTARSLYSDKQMSQERNLTSFHEIETKGVSDIEYQQDTVYSVKLVGDESMIRATKTRLEGNRLIIENDDDMKLFKNIKDKNIKIYISSLDLTMVKLAGVGDFETKGHLDTDVLKVFNYGVGDIDIDHLVCDKLEVENKGVGDVSADDVATRSSSISNKGVGDIDVHFSRCGFVDCKLTGVGDVELSGKIDRHQFDARGVGDIHLK